MVQNSLEENHLTQIVTFPTYRNSSLIEPKTTLNLIITDEPDRFIAITEGESLGTTPMGQAHCLITSSLALAHPSSHNNYKPRFIWSKADYVGLSNRIAAYNWTDMLEGFSVEDK